MDSSAAVLLYARIPPAPRDRHETLRALHILSAWGIGPPRSLETEIHTDPALDDDARKILPERKIICHLASSQPKKEWPLAHWAALHRLAAAAGLQLIFATGTGAREESLLANFKQLAPDAAVLPPVPNLALYLAVLKRATGFVSGDTGPLHFVAGWACRPWPCSAPPRRCFGLRLVRATGCLPAVPVPVAARWASVRARLPAWRRFRPNRFWPACKTF